MIRRIGYAKTMKDRLVMDLNEPFPIYETRKEAEVAIKESEAILFGVDCLYENFRSPFKVKKVEINLTK